MDTPAELAAAEITRLRDRLNDLRSVMAHADLWANGEPPPGVTRLLDGLPEMLDRIAQPANPVPALIQEPRPDVAELYVGGRRAPRRRTHLARDRGQHSGAGRAAESERRSRLRQSSDCREHGQDAGGVEQWGTTDIVHPEDLPQVAEVFTRSVASSSPYEIIERLRRSDGVYRWFHSKAFPLRGPDGQIVRWCALLNDIDEQKHAEDAVRASQRNLQLIIDTIPALAWSARADGSVEFFNRHYLDFIGFSGDRRAAGDGPPLFTLTT